MNVTHSTDLANELRTTIGRLIRRLRAERRQALSLPEITVLGRLERAGPATVSDLAGDEHVRPQSMAATVSQLVEQRLVHRTPDPTDGRRVLISLSEEGRRAILADRAQRETWLAEAIEGLSDEERDLLARALPVLDRLVDRP